MSWIYLLIASVLEIIFALSLKYSEGFSKLIPSILTIVFGTVSVIVLSFSLKSLPLGTGYAMWTGIGAVGTAILGILLFNEPRDITRLICIGLIICGIVGLRFSTGTTE